MAKKINLGATIALEGEKQYRQAIAGINSDMRVLTSEMKLNQAQFAGNQNSIQALTEKDRILNEQIEKQKEKVEALKLALENAQRQYGDNDTRTDQWRISLNNAETQLIRLDNELQSNRNYLREAENSTDGCATSIDQFGREVRAAQDNAETFGDILKANLASEVIINGVKALADGIKDISSSAVDCVKDTAAYADEVLTLSNNTGIATDTIQELMYMQELTDVSVDTLTSSMTKNIKAMSNASKGSETYAEAYEKLGVSITDANGELRDSETVFWECIDALGNMANETERDATAMTLFGKSAQDLNSVIKIGSDGVAEFAKEAQKAGAVLSEDTLDSLGSVDDAFQRFDQSIAIVKRNFGIELAPAIEKTVTKIGKALEEMDDGIYELVGGAVDVIGDVITWVIDNGDTIIAVIEGVTTAIIVQKVLDEVNSLWTKYKEATMKAEGAQRLLNIAMSESPIGLAAVLIGTAVTALNLFGDASDSAKTESEKLRDSMSELNESAQETKDSWEELADEIDNDLEEAEATAGQYQYLSDKLYELAEKESLSNTEKQQMSELVNQLNEAFPELGLAIDDVTNKLNLEKSVVDGTIESFKKKLMMEAAQEDLNKIAKEQYETQKELSTALEEQSRAYETLNKYIEENGEYYEKQHEAMKNQGYQNADHRYVEEYNQTVWDLTKACEEADAAVDTLNQTIDSQNQKFEETMKYIDGTNDSFGQLSTTVINFRGESKEILSEMAGDIQVVIEKYNEQYDAAYESIMGQITLFDEFSEKSEYTKEQILTNLQSQVDGLEKWSENFQELSNRGIDEGLLQELANMGPSAAGYLNELVSMTDEEISELNRLWTEKYNAAEAMASTTAEVLTGAEKQFAELEKMQKNKIESMISIWRNKYSEFEIIGENIMLGIDAGMKKKQESINTTINNSGSFMANTLRKTLGINSPSRVFSEIGEYMAEGIGVGYDKKIKLVNDSVSKSINTDFNLGLNNNSTFALNIAESVASAIAKLNLTMQVDGDYFGQLVNNTVYKEVTA